MNIGRTRADRIYNAILLAVAVCFLGYALFMAMGCLILRSRPNISNLCGGPAMALQRKLP